MKDRYLKIVGVIAVLATAVTLLAEVDILGYWWENPIGYQETPAGLVSLRASGCGVCHQEIYREWRLSAHAHALSDRQYQAELTKSPETQWLCLNCHTPLLNQRAEYAVAVEDGSAHKPVMAANPRYDAMLEEEAITCAVCHVRDGVILGPYGGSSAPHPVRQEPKLLTGETCAVCHQATASYTDTLICTFDTASEWEASPYAANGQSCSHCHMPEVERAIAPGGPLRRSRRHYFAGSMIPKEVMGSMNGLPLNPRHLHRSGLEVTLDSVTQRGGNTEVQLRLKNAHAGHLLPTGDPERHIIVEVSLMASGGEAGPQTLRIGQQWEWWPKARKLSDNRLKPFEERRETVVFEGERAGPYRVSVRVINVRIAEDVAKYHDLLGKYPTEVVVQAFSMEFD